jgi:hypothetical protein
VDLQVFAKRFWGFDPLGWPIISFRLDGNRDALVRASRPGDLIVFIGTETEETDPAERGRLLGLAEIGRTELDAADVLDFSTLKPSAFDDKGNIRWPKALPMLRAWRFVSPPRVKDVLGGQLSYEATVRAVLLDPTDTAAVLALPHEEVPVAEARAIVRQRQLNDALRFGGTTTGPRPTSWTSETGRDSEEPSCTYAFQFGSRNVWKIGHAKDVAARLVEMNTHVPVEVLGESWHLALQHLWPTEGAAYDIEQRVLSALRTPASVGERVSCSRRALESAWSASLVPSQVS